MIRVAHLLDDFAMGGVTRGLGVFAEPELAALAKHEIVPVSGRTALAPRLDADVIVTHIPPAWNRLAFFRSIRIRNPQARWVHVEHSYTAAWEARFVDSRMRFRAMLWLALGSADEVVAVSRGQAVWLAQASRRRVRTICPWPGRPELLELEPPVFAAGEPLRLAAYGRFADQKNFLSLIEAVASLPPALVELHLGGEGPHEAAIRAAAEPFGHIHLHGRVDDLAAFLAPAQAVIVPSIYEAFGQVALEARLAARPVLVADLDGLSEQAPGAGLAADCSTPAAIAAAIRYFASLPLSTIAETARESTQTHRGSVIAGWGELFDTVTRRARSPLALARVLRTA